MPGRSIMLAVSESSNWQKPVFLSTVTPGKLPTFWLRPVKALKSDDLPELGLPTRAMFKCFAAKPVLLYINRQK